MDLAVAPNYPMFLCWLSEACNPPLSITPSRVRFVSRPEQLHGCSGNTIYVINGGPDSAEIYHTIKMLSSRCTIVNVNTLPLDIAGSTCYTAATGTTRE